MRASLEDSLDDDNLTPDLRAKLNGLLYQFQDFEPLFAVLTLSQVLIRFEKVQTVLQRRGQTIYEVRKLTNDLLDELQLLRDSFDDIWPHITAYAKDVLRLPEPKLKRRINIPKRYLENVGSKGVAYHPKTPQEQCRDVFVYVMDMLMAGIRDRFNDNDLKLLSGVENILISAINHEYESLSDIGLFENLEQLDRFKKLYEKDINMRELHAELLLLYREKEEYNKSQTNINNRITYVVSMEQVIHIIKARTKTQVERNRICCTFTLIRIYLTPALSSAEAERGFSKLKLHKTELRSMMGAERMNACLLMISHRKLTEDIDRRQAAVRFIGENVKRLNFFGKH
jgi:hypothetical protein